MLTATVTCSSNFHEKLFPHHMHSARWENVFCGNGFEIIIPVDYTQRHTDLLLSCYTNK